MFLERFWRSVKYEEVYLRAYDCVGMFAFRYDRKLGWWPMNKPAKSETAMTEGDAMRQG